MQSDKDRENLYKFGTLIIRTTVIVTILFVIAVIVYSKIYGTAFANTTDGKFFITLLLSFILPVSTSYLLHIIRAPIKMKLKGLVVIAALLFVALIGFMEKDSSWLGVVVIFLSTFFTFMVDTLISDAKYYDEKLSEK